MTRKKCESTSTFLLPVNHVTKKDNEFWFFINSVSNSCGRYCGCDRFFRLFCGPRSRSLRGRAGRRSKQRTSQLIKRKRASTHVVLPTNNNQQPQRRRTHKKVGSLVGTILKRDRQFALQICSFITAYNFLINSFIKLNAMIFVTSSR